MADESGAGPDQVTKHFGLIIAFLLPGFMGLWALSYFDPGVAAWIHRAAAGSTSVGDFLLVVVASVGLGVFLSGLRFILFEQIPLLKWMGVPDKVAEGSRVSPERQRQANEEHYKYYLFYANTAIALLFVYIASLLRPGQWNFWIKTGAFAFAGVVLVLSARDAITRFRTKIRRPDHHPGRVEKQTA